MPRSTTIPGTITPDRETTAALAQWLATHADGWRPGVLLSADPAVRVADGRLVLGLPLLRCLRDSELCVVLTDARAQMETRRPTMPWRRQQSEDPEVRRARYGAYWDQVVERVDVVAEAWTVLDQQWLTPALEQGVWYDEPFSGLRAFLDSCARSGLVDDGARLPGADVDIDLTVAEHDAATLLVPVETARSAPSAWSDHPTDVVVAGWRARVIRGLEVASEVSGRPVGPALGELLPIALYADLALADGLDATTDSVHDLLLAAVGLSLLGSGGLSLGWEWPTGTAVRAPDGSALDLDTLVADRGAVAERVVALGGRLEQPLLP